MGSTFRAELLLASSSSPAAAVKLKVPMKLELELVEELKPKLTLQMTIPRPSF